MKITSMLYVLMLTVLTISCKKDDITWQDQKARILGEWNLNIEGEINYDNGNKNNYTNTKRIEFISNEAALIIDDTNTVPMETEYDWFYQIEPEYVLLNSSGVHRQAYNCKVIKNLNDEQLWEVTFRGQEYDPNLKAYQKFTITETWLLSK